MRSGVLKDLERRSLTAVDTSKIDKDQQRLHNLQMIEHQIELERTLKKL